VALTGSELLVRALRDQGLDTLFYLMGGPMLAAERAWLDAGLRAVDVRHEEAAAMMAHAYARVGARPGLCMAASGPGTANLVAGVANAFVDGAPVVAIGGSSPLAELGRGAFQEIDQVAMMRPVTRHAERIVDPRRIPDAVATAMRHCIGGRPGPVYLDLPADVLHRAVDEAEVPMRGPVSRQRPRADPAAIDAAVTELAASRRPVAVSGSGVLWSGAATPLRRFVEAAGVPLFTTPQGRGVVPEDHPLCMRWARSTAFQATDLVIVVGTRLNWILGYGLPPRFNRDTRIVQVDIDPAEIGRNRHVEHALVGDAAAVLDQLRDAVDGRVDAGAWSAWRDQLRVVDERKREAHEEAMATDAVPVHPLRLCRDLRDVLRRDAVVVVDGHEILNFARHSLPTHVPGHRLNSGPFGHMGVGLPYALGAKVAKPGAQVVALVGDGSLGMSVMELDTAVRHSLDVTVVVSNNGGWTSSVGDKPGRDLGFTHFDRVAAALGCHGQRITEPAAIGTALKAALSAGRPALVDVVTDAAARSETVHFARYEW